jgi:uncharacterized membrane protein (GlpM family)
MVQVAMILMVLIAFLIIAIDIGNLMNERRRMQNAADAGALAGAWELCFGEPSMASARASEYAIDRNGAEVASVTVYSYTVTVRASESVDTYLAGLIGVMPLTGALVLVWVYLENRGDPVIMQDFAKGALWGILPSILFFLVALFCFRKQFPLPLVLCSSFGIWIVAAFVHQLLLK